MTADDSHRHYGRRLYSGTPLDIVVPTTHVRLVPYAVRTSEKSLIETFRNYVCGLKPIYNSTRQW